MLNLSQKHVIGTSRTKARLFFRYIAGKTRQEQMLKYFFLNIPGKACQGHTLNILLRYIAGKTCQE